MSSEPREYDKDKWYQTVQSLLARAMDERLSPGERDACQAKADAIMLKHKIDVAMATSFEKEGPNSIVHEDWALELPYEFYDDFYAILVVIADHCGIRIVTTWRKATVIGQKVDVEFAQMLWTTIVLEFTRRLYPAWDKDKTFDENVYNFVKSGYKWAAIHSEHLRKDPATAPPKLSGRYKAGYTRECLKRGEEATSHTQRHGAFRASYAQSFQTTIRQRLFEMRRASEKEVVDDADRYAVAVRSTRDRVNEEFCRLFPQFDPERQAENYRKHKEREDARRAAMTQEQRDAEDRRNEEANARARRNWDRLQNKNYDRTGWAAGRAAGSAVDLSGGRGKVTPNRNELEGS